jgi:hypothetical protein
VPDSPGLVLFAALRRQLMLALAQARGVLTLSDLPGAGQEWDGTAVAGRLLERIGGDAPADPLAAATINALNRLTFSADGFTSELRGWQPDPGANEPRGLAYALRTAPGELIVVLAVTGDGDGARMQLVASGARAAEAEFTTGGGWTVKASGAVNGTIEAAFGTQGAAQISGATAGDRFRVEFSRADDGGRLGDPNGPGLRLGALSLGGELLVDPNLSAHPKGFARSTGGAVEILPSALAGVVPQLPPMPFTADVGLDPVTGATLGGSTTLRTRLPSSASLPGLELGALDVIFEPQPPDASTNVGISLATSLKAGIAGLPIRIRIDGAGIKLPFEFGLSQARGFLGGALEGISPDGAGVDLDLPLVRAAGALRTTPDGQYSGRLTASIPPLSATAFGVLAPPSPPKRPFFSFLAMIGATFPPPGIQVGFGFAVSGIGGVVGVNRRSDREALIKAVTDGSAAGLLFPADPAKTGDAAVAALPGIFPPAQGSVISGPMFQLDWGGQIVTASIAVLAEVSNEVRITILGRLAVALPHPAAPLILLQATFFGQVDPAEPSVLFVASLTGSHIVGVPLNGDLCVVTRGGDDPTFVLSAGGFHPAFGSPRGVPQLRRIGMDLSPSPFLDLRCEAYFAVTTNTVQFGARLELVAEVAECGLRGHLGLDVLIHWEPRFSFVADVSAGIAVEVFGETLTSVNLDLRLEGPTPWHARGRGSVSLFLFSASFDFDVSWGSAPPLSQPAPDVADALRKALEAPGAWVVHRPAARTAVRLTSEADLSLGRGELVDPHGSLTVRQRTVPLGVRIDRFNRLPLPAPQTWELGDPRLDQNRQADRLGDVPEEFAPGQFIGMRDDELLSDPAFQRFRGGFDIDPKGSAQAKLKPAPLTYETEVIGEREAPKLEVGGLLDRIGVLEAIGTCADVTHPIWWQPPEEVVSIAPETPVVAASNWSLVPEAVTAPGPTALELRQALADQGRTDLSVVGAWEVET